jgi:hypothetical protein
LPPALADVPVIEKPFSSAEAGGYGGPVMYQTAWLKCSRRMSNHGESRHRCNRRIGRKSQLT